MTQIIDYQKELLNLLKNNSFSVLPSQEVINSHKDFALAVWKNYWPYEYSEYSQKSTGDKFREKKWSTVLKHYKKDMSFWNEALEESSKLLLKVYFKEEFPEVVDYFLAKEDKMIDFFNKTKEEGFLNYIYTEPIKTKLYKESLFNKFKGVSPEDLKNFQDDEDFVKKALDSNYQLYNHLDLKNKKNPEYIKISLKNPKAYNYLDEEDKKNPEYIKLFLKDKESWSNLSPELKKQEAIENYWFMSHVYNFHTNEIKTMSENKKLIILEHRSELIGTLLSNDRDYHLYKNVVGKLLEKDFSKFIEKVPVKIVEKIAKDDIFESPELLSVMEKVIKDYKRTNKLENYDEKIILIVKNTPELKPLKKQNLFLQFQERRYDKNPFKEKDFYDFADLIIKYHKENKISKEEGTQLIHAMKSLCEIEFGKTLPRTKDFFTYYIHEKLKQEIVKTQENEYIVKKNKI